MKQNEAAAEELAFETEQLLAESDIDDSEPELQFEELLESTDSEDSTTPSQNTVDIGEPLDPDEALGVEEDLPEAELVAEAQNEGDIASPSNNQELMDPNNFPTPKHSSSPEQTPDTQFATGVHYIKNVQNHYLGAKWLRKAGMQGHAKAQFYLGLLFLKGEGVPKSFFHAYCWLSLAACQNLNEAIEARKKLEPYMTAREINASLKLAAERAEQIFDIQ